MSYELGFWMVLTKSCLWWDQKLAFQGPPDVALRYTTVHVKKPQVGIAGGCVDVNAVIKLWHYQNLYGLASVFSGRFWEVLHLSLHFCVCIRRLVEAIDRNDRLDECYIYAIQNLPVVG